MKLLILPFCFLFFLSCWLSPEAIAAPGVTISPTSDSVYGIQGNDFSDASGIDITIRYDPAALASPQVAQGGLVGGALMAVNVSTPGNIRLALVRVTAISGSGTIATITFTRVKSTGADILSLVSSAINSSGKNIPVTAEVVNSVKMADSGVSTGQQAEQPTSVSSPSADAGTPVTATSPIPSTPVTTAASPVPSAPDTSATAPTGIVGVVVSSAATSSSDIQGATPPTDQPAPDMQQPNIDAVVPPESGKDSSGEKMIAKANEPERKKVKLHQSVLERFKDFKGEKTPKTFMALFNMQDQEANQDPPIVLSNGKTTVKIVLELDSKGENNNFLLDGVSLVSLKNKEKDFWIVELLPDPRAYEATVSVPRKKQLYVIPLTIAPPMDVNIERSAKRLTEADFELYLKNKGTIKAPRFDLNGDGVRNYIDDYIFTANYLSQSSTVPTKPSTR